MSKPFKMENRVRLTKVISVDNKMEVREGHSQYRCDIYGLTRHNKKKLVNTNNAYDKILNYIVIYYLFVM